MPLKRTTRKESFALHAGARALGQRTAHRLTFIGPHLSQITREPCAKRRSRPNRPTIEVARLSRPPRLQIRVYFHCYSLFVRRQGVRRRAFWRVPGRFEKKELEDHLFELFPEGLSPHGWRFMLDRYDYIRDPITNDAFVNHTWQVEFAFEMVRRAAFPKMNSRFQSYFAWERLDAARSFRKETQTIYRIQAEKGFRADQNWLTLGTQGVATSWAVVLTCFNQRARCPPEWASEPGSIPHPNPE